MKILILAGGTGKRLWPVSRKSHPKQFQPLIGKDSLLKYTYRRLKKGFLAKDIFISINQDQLVQVKRELGSIPKNNFIIEPVKKGTAGAIGLATWYFYKKNPDEIIATVNSDHFIKDEKKFIATLKSAEKVVEQNPDHLLLIGINPTYPETGYGYIKLKRQIKPVDGRKIFTVDSFKEKPDLKTARQYLRSWAYLWNPAYFVFRTDTMAELFKKHLPRHWRILNRISQSPARLKAEFKKMQKISIDYGIMEKAKKMLCLPAEFDWADVGHWKIVQEILAKGSNQNVVKGDYVHLDGTGNLVYSYSGKLIATVGIKDSIIIEDGEVILVCAKNKAQEVKKIVEELEKRKLNRYL